MLPYQKHILSISDQLQSYKDAGMIVSSDDEALSALKAIGYYRLRGYCYHLYNNATKKFVPGTDFSSILKLYNFDQELSHLLFNMISKIEVALRARLSDALLIHNDPLILQDPSVFNDKKLYWKNLSSTASEISRSSDVFIQHNFDVHDGAIPIWAGVEIMSFGTLSKTIKNLKTGAGSSYSTLAANYQYKSPKGSNVTPSLNILSSWIHAVSILRNMCAHNSRIYNRIITTKPQILDIDQQSPPPRVNGLYQIILAMKYLRPNENSWNQFYCDLDTLLMKYDGYFDFARINFPQDWKSHFRV